ncbi:MAG: PAS domain-containing protein [Chloroflexi bacterium]|nr:PAS domain-containing protein [Chloroflexota bacterium]
MAAKNRSESVGKEPGFSQEQPTDVKSKRGDTGGKEGMKYVFPIVGIGASAGGLEALGQFLNHVPPDSGIAFIIVQHLDPTHTSAMPDLLKRTAQIPVSEAKDGERVEPDHVYIIPPHKNMTIMHRTLQLIEQPSRPGLAHNIDLFFRSLAVDEKERSICIVLSGTGTDGVIGARAVKAEGGMVMVQDPDTARYDGMPRSVQASGAADFSLPSDKLPEKLIEYVKKSYGKRVRVLHEEKPVASSEFQKVLSLVRAKSGHDFSGYKLSTINRRIERRMGVNQIDNMGDYLRYMQNNPVEADALFKDFLINVTSFFRDPEAFVALKEKLKELLSLRDEGSTIRAWVLGCSTGEEAYSIAILMDECMRETDRHFEMQVFGTDIDADAIHVARLGIYPGSVADDVSPERLKRYFVRKDDQFQIKKEIREKVIFAVQDALADPPFSRMDLISSRNFLIYLSGELQKKLFPVLRYALYKNGLLFLGTAETIGEFNDLFMVLDRKWRIYQAVARPIEINIPEVPPFSGRLALLRNAEVMAGAGREGERLCLAEKTLLEALPPAVLLDEKHQIVYVHGQTSKYLELPEGAPNQRIIDMARPGVGTALASAIQESITRQKEVVREGVRVKHNGDSQLLKITVRPATALPRGSLVVVFQDVAEIKKKRRKGTEETDARITELEQELQYTRESLRSTVEELETANEELRSANEEYQSTNEELQSTNEELETSREELQSVNEELMTVNTEHQGRIDQLSAVKDDMNNLLNNTGIATIFLNEDFKIERYTPAATEVFNLIESDVGRPVDHVTSSFKLNKLSEHAAKVMNSLVPIVEEMETRDGKWYSLRIHPYRTAENVIAGVVMSFIDITRQKKLEASLKSAAEYAGEIVDTVREPLLVLDAGLKVVSAGRSFYRAFKTDPGNTEGRLVYELGNRQWDIPPLRKLLGGILSGDKTIEDFEVEHDFPRIGHRRMLLNARRLRDPRGDTDRILLAIEDVTGK